MNSMLLRCFCWCFCIFLGQPALNVQAAGPNILHIHTDDHRADGLHALGNKVLKTPHLDQLVQRGMTFTCCYTQGSMIGAVCTPSRTMLLTGRSWQRIPKAPGATANADDPATFLPRVLAAANYQTWHLGKPGNAFTPGINAFETSIADAGTGDSRATSSRRMADRSIEFLKDRVAHKESRPFYMYLAPPVPHDPRVAEPEFHQLYRADDIPLSPAFMPQHPWDNGEMTVRDEQLAPWPRTPQNTRQQLADYYACLSCLDHHVGRIFEALQQTGQWDNTLIVFSADNGLSLGEHGLFGKQNLYEFGGMHVPLVIAGPGVRPGKSAALVYLMDLFPTFADIAGAKLPTGVEGRSLKPLLDGQPVAVRDALYTGYRQCMRAVRTERWKLIRYPLVDRTQLFDLSVDPLELNNLAAQPAHASQVAAMTTLLQREMATYGDLHPLTVTTPQPAEWTPPKEIKRQAPSKQGQRANKRPSGKTPR